MSAPISGGSMRPRRGRALSATNAATMGSAIQRSSLKARTRSRPKRRNTPATIAITIGIGRASIARRTQPVSPSTSMRIPVATKAPITSGKLRCVSAGPTSTAPGMLQRKTSGCRYASDSVMLITPFRKNAANTHEARSVSLNPPRAPTERMIATGPLMAKRNATNALPA